MIYICISTEIKMMDFDENFLINFTSIAGLLVTAIITCFTIVQRMKNRWPVRVNCWFCNNYSKIPREQREWWLCDFCEQRNGFTKDGDYNYDIPEQHEGPKQKQFVRYSELSTAKESTKKNGLCSKCNRNEEMKISQMANFEPSSDKKYYSELEVFKKNLELKYKLCQKCSKVVEGVLSKQASWLLQYKMAFFKNRPIQNIINNGEKWERVFRIILTILNPTILYDAAFWPLPIAGLLLQLGACLASPANKQGFDMVAAFFWILIIILTPFKELKLLKIHLENEWFAVEYITQYHVIIGLTVIIGLMNLRSRLFTVAPKPKVALKKLESPIGKKVQSVPSVPNVTKAKQFVRENPPQNVKIETKPCRSPVNITNLLMTPVSVETPMPIKPTIFMQNSGLFQTDLMGSMSLGESRWARENQSPSSMKSFSYRSFDDKTSLNESLSTLSSLSLSNKHRKQTSKTPKMFETRVYDSASPDLFTKINRSPNRKFVLSPPKLKSVTQTSWVAGGYWQAGMDVPTLSRSSSQSSGFGSTGSNFVPSREPSVYNDCDRYSVVSDATQCCHMSRQNSANSMTSHCHRGSAFSFQRPDSPTYSQFSMVPQSTTLGQSNMQSAHNFQANNHFHSRPSMMNVSNSSNVQEAVPTQTVYTTVLASPVWLPALLCGSLVFNMIVLCTTLLR